MHRIATFLLIYIFLAAVVVPVALAEPDEVCNLVNDSILHIILSSYTVFDVISDDLLFDSITRRRFVRRKRKSVSDIFSELGPYYARRAYRMDEVQFWKLYNIIYKTYPRANKKRKRDGRDKTTHVNGRIHLSLRLSIAIRFFAGGSPYDLMLTHGVGYNDVYHSIWQIIDTINSSPGFSISFPTCHDKQREIATHFASKSSMNFENCVGCVDGILIWTSKPSKPILLRAGLGVIKFFCGRKKRFGLNMQAICDHKLRFLDIDIAHPASTSDYLAFATSPICKLLEKPGFLADGLSIYGDNAYVNAPYMVTPFKAVSSGVRDAYNFFQSQLRINIECAFGVLVNRWGILRSPIPLNISLEKTTSLVRSLCLLHNWLIDEKDIENIPSSSPSSCNYGEPIGGTR